MATPDSHIPSLRPPLWGLLAGLLTLLALIYLVVTHLGELSHFAQLARQAEPKWILVSIVLQLATYLCAGLIWRQVAGSTGKRLKVSALARLAVEKLSIDQLLPTAGMSGSLVVMRAMRRLGATASGAMEAIVIDMFSYYLSFALVALITVFIMYFYHGITTIVIELLGAFTLIAASVPFLIWWLVRHRNWQPPQWLRRRKVVTQTLEALAQVSPQRLYAPRLIVSTTLLHVAIFLLDSATLWTMLQVTGTPAGLHTSFAAMVMGSVAGAVSFLPGGIGGFEVGCTTTLTLLGVPIEASLTATLLLRGFTLWLPLLPGLFLARRDMM